MSALRRVRHDPAALGALCVLAGLTVLSLAWPWLGAGGESIDWSQVATGPSLADGHWLGTDRLGRDLLARTLSGARVSLAVGLLASAVTLSFGIVYGATAGYLGGRTDHLMMRFIEIVSGLPLIFFIIFMTTIFGRNEYVLFTSIGAVGWLTMARIVRGQTLSLRQREFVDAAIVCGADTPRVLAGHIVPNALGPVLAYATLTVPQIIMLESFLSFLGLGIQEPRSSLGTLIAEGAGEMESAPWMLLVPGAWLAVLLLALSVLGDRLRAALDADDA